MMDLDRMSEENRYFLKHIIIHTQRYERAHKRFPKLRGLADVGQLGSPLIPSEKPMFAHAYFTEAGIYL
ncbi:hypothetical protein OH783_03390 [Kocuria rhizophila]|uniref:hypothetical protein n=1 Tax=Kocuria rhizophila TaxID=72000 RepID=UPI00386F7DF1|nr:hypothetical protein OH783_03390 [Kocuria rhizophila]WSZ54464.1 hypothetical protein OG926_03410 [Kocuria rhizophila]